MLSIQITADLITAFAGCTTARQHLARRKTIIIEASNLQIYMKSSRCTDEGF